MIVGLEVKQELFLKENLHPEHSYDKFLVQS